MKRFLAMLLAVLMVVSVLPTGVIAESGTPEPQAEQTTAEKHTKYSVLSSHAHVENDAHICEHCVAAGAADTTPTWIAWGDDAAEKTQLPTAAGHYYITADLSNMTSTDLTSGNNDIVICLNGKTLTAKQGSATQRFYSLGSTNKVTILDCTAHTDADGNYVAGKFTGATYSTFFFKYAKNTEAILTIYDGIITNSTKKESSGIKNGGGISMQGPCTLNLFGGEISNCRANNGAAIHVQNTASTVNIDGAVIKNNTAITAGSAIYCNQDTWTAEGNDNITIKNATITGNTSETAGAACLGAIYVGDAKQTGAVITLGGNNQITGNTDKDGAAYDLYLQNKADDQLKLVIEGLDSNAKIGVRLAEDRLAAADGLTISTALDTDHAKNFACNNDGYRVIYKENVLQLEKSGPHIHKVCNGNAACLDCTHTDVTYEPWESATSLPTSGNYYLTGDVVISAQASISGSLNLCLNGYTVSVKSGVNCRHFWLTDKADLKLTNCSSAAGILTGANGASIMNLYNKTATLEAYNVTFKGNRYTGGSNGGGAIMMQGTTTVKLVGCKLLENQGASGAVIRNHRPNSSVTLIGCEVKGNSADSISAIRLDDVCTLTLIDTVITGNTTTKSGDESLGAIHAAKAGATIKVGGTTQITGNTDGSGKEVNLFLTENGNVVTVEGLTGTAKIGVTLKAERTDHVITGKLNGVNAAPFFSADNAELAPAVKDDVVVLGSAAQNQHKHKLCADSGCTDHEGLTFEPWTDATKLPTSGNYYLETDVTLGARTAIAGTTLNLCLNGHTIKIKDGVTARHFWMSASGKLNITNCSATEGIITGGKQGSIMTENSGSCAIELYNIVFEGNSNPGGNGGVLLPQGSATILAENCIFRNNTGSSSGGVLRVYNKSSVTLIGCELKNNSAGSMGVIRQDNGSLTLIDTVIENNSVTATGTYNYGAVYVVNGNSTFTVKGQTRIINNTDGDGKKSNVNFQHTDGNQAVITVDGLTGNAMIGMTLQPSRLKAADGRTITKKLGGVDASAFFAYDTDDYEILVKDDVLVVADKSYHIHNLCNDSACTEHGQVTFQDWKTANALPDSGAYCLQTDVELASGAHIAAELQLCLNGHTVKFKDGSTISMYMKSGATLTITDCQGSGKITGGVKNYGGMINVSEGSTLNLYGGTITGNKSVNLDNDKGKGGAIYLSKASGTKPGGVFNMYGGTITENEAYRGGAVYLCSGSAFNMYGGTITKNTATYRGGAITNDGVVTVNIAGGTISENTAKGGAAVYLCNGAAMTISGGEIKSNTATGAGGAILIESEGSKLTVTGGTLEGNSTSSQGGAIYASRDTAFEMTGGTIANNKASGGAGIYLNEVTATITGGTFTGNEATNDAGAIAVYKSELTLKDAAITGNLAGNTGAGVWDDRGTLRLSGDLVIQDNKVGEKASNLYLLGNAVFTVEAMGENAKIGIAAERVYGAMSGTTDTDCSAAFFSDDTSLKVAYREKAVWLMPVEEHKHCLCNDKLTDCKLEAVEFAPWNDSTKLPRSGNYYLTTDVQLSVAAFAEADLNLCLNGYTVSIQAEDRIINMKAGANLAVTDCKDTGKITGGVHDYGGVINVNAGSTFNLYGGTLTGNQVVHPENDKGKGGAIYLSKVDGDTPGGVFNMYGGTISENKAYRGGAVYLCDGSTFNLYGGTLAKNEATYRGGAVTNDGKVTVNMYGGTVTENKAKAAAAFYVVGGAQLTISGGEITKHSIQNVGSVMLIESKGTKVLLTGGTIANNTTTENGTIYISKNTTFEMTGGTIANNKAKNGAGLYVNESTCYVKGGNIKNNEATGSGAGVFFLKPVDGHISGGNITGNRTQSYGAGVYVYNNATATISGGNISYNTCVKGAGGGVCLMGGTLNLKGGTIGYNENLSSNKGGGIMMYGGTLKMTGGHLVGNKVKDGVSGAAICTTGIDQTKNGVKTTRPSKIDMYGGTISDHKGNYGGAVILQSKTVMNMYGGTFRNNEAKGDGGAVYLNGKSVFNMYGGSMINNKAGNRGGAICYFANTSGEITACKAEGNYAGGYGGFLAAHGIGTKLSIKDLNISGHECKGYGGAISITWNAQLDMENCVFSNNKAKHGGALFLAHKTVCNLKDVQVFDNVATENGGGFYLDVGNVINFTNVQITNNESGKNGGGIHTRANLHLLDCLIDGNKAAQNGGGISTGGAFTYGNLPEHTNGYVGRGQGLIIENTKVTNNEAVGSGGGVYMAKQNWNTLINAEISGNVCGEIGSGLYVADDLMIKGGATITGNTSKTDGYAVYFNANVYDGQSHLLTVHEIGGNVVVKDNKGGEVFLGKDVALAPTVEGYGQDTYFTVTLYEGLLTNWVLGEYNYEGEDPTYVITYGTRSFDEPMMAEPEEEESQPGEETTEGAQAPEAGEDNTMLYAGIGGIAAVVILAAIVLVIVKKKKTPAAGKE